MAGARRSIPQDHRGFGGHETPMQCERSRTKRHNCRMPTATVAAVV